MADWEAGSGNLAYADLATAIRKKSNVAVCYWWGITPQTVTNWRKGLNVGRITEGTQAAFDQHLTSEKVAEMHRLLKPTNRELIAVIDGYRESKQSWMELLLDLSKRTVNHIL